ncbi:hypothetical protein ACLB2K_016530 [Fragaria x ananassa]
MMIKGVGCNNTILCSIHSIKGCKYNDKDHREEREENKRREQKKEQKKRRKEAASQQEDSEDGALILTLFTFVASLSFCIIWSLNLVPPEARKHDFNETTTISTFPSKAPMSFKPRRLFQITSRSSPKEDYGRSTPFLIATKYMALHHSYNKPHKGKRANIPSNTSLKLCFVNYEEQELTLDVLEYFSQAMKSTSYLQAKGGSQNLKPLKK